MWTQFRVIAVAFCACALLAGGTMALLMADIQQRKPSPDSLLKILEEAEALEVDYSRELERQSVAGGFGFADYSISDQDEIKAFTKALKQQLDGGTLKETGGRLLQATFVDVRVLAHPDDKQPLATIMLYTDALVFTKDGDTFYYHSRKDDANDLFRYVVRKDLMFGQRPDQKPAD